MRIDAPRALASDAPLPVPRGGGVLGTWRREGGERVVEWFEGTGS